MTYFGGQGGILKVCPRDLKLDIRVPKLQNFPDSRYLETKTFQKELVIHFLQLNVSCIHVDFLAEMI